MRDDLLHILIVDDTESDRILLKYALKSSHLDHDCAEAKSFEEALLFCKKTQFSCVFLDYRMPGMDGLKGIKILHDLYPHLPIIMVSSQGDELVATEALKSGASDYIPKDNINPNLLAQAIKNVLKKNDLEQKIEQQHAEIVKINSILEEKNKHLLSLYRTMAHELKTPLTAIIEYIRLISDGLAGQINQQQKDFLNIAIKNCNLLNLYIDDLLNISKLETRSVALKIQTCNINAIIEDAINSVKTHSAKKDLTITFNKNSNIPLVKADPVRIQEILINLLNNAIKYTAEHGHITISLNEMLSFVQVAVQDTGIGIDPKEFTKIFEPLYQIASAKELSKNGLGLGLAICKELIQMHGGTIHATSEHNQGSTFYFTLPQAKEES